MLLLIADWCFGWIEFVFGVSRVPEAAVSVAVSSASLLVILLSISLFFLASLPLSRVAHLTLIRGSKLDA